MSRPQLVLMGRAAGAFGVAGELKVYSHAEDPQVFLRAGTVYIGPNPETARAYTLQSQRPHAGRLLFRLEELGNREEAEALGGQWVYVDRSVLPPLAEDEYYWYQIKGAQVETAGGLKLGRLEAVLDHGAHELWVVKSDEGREAILPVIEGFIKEMDLKGGRLVVEPPEGLLEAQGWPEE
jgi:16S rRNA processing protein RimM